MESFRIVFFFTGMLWILCCFVKCSEDIDIDSQEVTITCGRNQYLDIASASCRPCRTCYFVDQEQHTFRSCDHCHTAPANVSSLIYCPVSCVRHHGGWPAWLRVIFSAMVLVAVPFVVIPLALVTNVIFTG